jgi:parallel beta-helix repeat protein
MRAALAVLSLALPAGAQETSPAAGSLVTVRQTGAADFVGTDDSVLQSALRRLQRGGTLVLGPGRYLVRRSLLLPADVVLRGEEGAVLALPAPALTAGDAPAGTRELVLAQEGEFAARTLLQILPPRGSQHFPDGQTKALELQKLEAAEGARLTFVEPFPCAIPAGSRVGYPHKLLQLSPEGRATIENLSFDGGRVPSIPMQGHWQRCAIWGSAPFGFGEHRLGPPGIDVTISHCRFTNWYGRAIALYHMRDSLIEGCLIEHCSDEAIDLDHFCEGIRVAGNEVRDATWGIVLNDASRNLVEYNRIQDCEIGIWNWWYEKTPQQAINEENVIRHNLIRGARQAAIRVAPTCHRNVIEHNFLEGALEVAEPSNTVAGNTRL